jgi:UDP-N-acetylglucosamine--N-acetylmuramyl-(pentapeptide) pyrophosphoryl-undecaprenol N-acetylglucosamine transferase
VTGPAAGGERFALLAGGGTAGHLRPALAVAEALVDAGHVRSSIEFVGSARGQDGDTLEGLGFPVTLLPGRGIVRGLSPSALRANAGAVAGLLVAAVRGFGLVRRSRPRVVVSVGGYASLPASVAAVVLRVPLVLVNIDAVPGAANRLLGRFARASAVGWPGTPLPRAVVTGTPVRAEIAAVRHDPAARGEARRQLGLPDDRPTVAVFGGSLGARRINQAIGELADRWKDRDDRSIYHIVGRRDWVEGDPTAPDAGSGGVTGEDPAVRHGLVRVLIPYQDNMSLVYTAADLVVSRAGAMTVAELAAAGVPAVLVPLPGSPGDHQTANARVLADAGAAVLLSDAQCDGERLAQVIDALLADPDRGRAMSGAAAGLSRTDAAAAAAAVVEANARTRSGGRR